MSLRLIVNPLAENDLFEAEPWHDTQRQGLGTELLDEVTRVFERIARTRESRDPVPRSARRDRQAISVCRRLQAGSQSSDRDRCVSHEPPPEGVANPKGRQKVTATTSGQDGTSPSVTNFGDSHLFALAQVLADRDRT